jgi:uncharacterized membrane protein YfcA
MLTALSVGIIFLLAGLTQGLTGFGAALVALPLLCFFLDIKTVVPLCVLNSVIITVTLAIQLRTTLTLKKIMPLCIASIPGIIVGVTLLKSVDTVVMRFLLGLLLALYALYNLSMSLRPRRLHQAYSWIAGFFSGAIRAAFSAGGPPAIIYATLNDWSKDEIKATLAGFFLFNSCITAIIHGLSGVTTGQSLMLFIVSAPFVLAGTVGGSLLYRILPGEKYRTIIFIFLFIMGILMMDFW